MVDLSLGGAAVLIEGPPPGATPVWVRLDRPAAPDWAAATICEVVTARGYPSLLRLRFVEPCAYAFFKGAVAGLDVTGRAVHVSPEFSGPDWR
jgi:hypothetical protein